MSSTLFHPLQVGRMQMPHRIAMAPMTRFRADDAHVPLPFVKEYYAQRAAVPGTLIITEATLISPRAGVYPNVPAIYSREQIAAWREVTDAVHAKKSFIYLQLWALGRVAKPEVLAKETGDAGPGLISSSPVPAAEGMAVPRAMSEEEIKALVGDYAQAARNALEAGFDGVEIHGANGYLIDQFNQDTCNQRTDGYGGSVEKRGRFALEVIRAVVDAVGADRTAIRYSPFSTFQGMRMADEDLKPQFTYLAEKTAEFGLAFVHLVEGRIAGTADIEPSEADNLDFFMTAYGPRRPVVVAGGFTPESAKEAVDVRYKEYEVVVAFGRPFTSNPDLPFKVQNGIPLRPFERDHFYVPKEPKGYVDYEFSEEFKTALAAA